MTRQCEGCGAALSEQFVRVFFPEGITDPPYCLHCEDRPKANCHRDTRTEIPTNE